MTQKTTGLAIFVLWATPSSLILILFSSIKGQGFLSEECGVHDFLLAMPFRAVYSSLIIVPTILILAIYAYFHYLLWRKRRDFYKQAAGISRQNIKAAKTTLLIMMTCTFGWMPAVTNHLLICNEGCRYQPSDFSMEKILLIHSIAYILIILKSFTNPLIFAVRQKNIQAALKRLFYLLRHCKQAKFNEFQHRKSQSRATSFKLMQKM